jgi:hypothetical protein
MNKLFIYFIVGMFLFSFTSAVDFGYNYLDQGDKVITGANYSINVNNTNFLEGHPASYFYPASNPNNYINTSPDLSDYVPYNGSTTNLNFTKNIYLANQENAKDNQSGIIYKGASLFIHNFRHATGNTARPAGLNTFMGIDAGTLNMGSTATQTSHGSYNSGFGYNVLNAITTGAFNLGAGSRALEINTTGGGNIALGYNALSDLTTGSNNIGIGYNAMYDGAVTGSNNIGIGNDVLRLVTSGATNIGIGLKAGLGLTTGSSNILLGEEAGYTLTSNTGNILIGKQAGKLVATGQTNNVIIGTSAGLSLASSSSNNVLLGYGAGQYYGINSALTSSDSAILIGYEARGSANGQVKEIAIGYKVSAKGSNTAIIGGVDNTDVYLTGNIRTLNDSWKHYFGTGQNFSIHFDGTNAIFNTSVVGSGLAYFSNNVSATGFITRTSIYDKSKGSALDLIKDASELETSKGDIDHSKFYGYTQFNVTDYSKPVIIDVVYEECITDEKDLEKQMDIDMCISLYSNIYSFYSYYYIEIIIY